MLAIKTAGQSFLTHPWPMAGPSELKEMNSKKSKLQKLQGAGGAK